MPCIMLTFPSQNFAGGALQHCVHTPADVDRPLARLLKLNTLHFFLITYGFLWLSMSLMGPRGRVGRLLEFIGVTGWALAARGPRPGVRTLGLGSTRVPCWGNGAHVYLPPPRLAGSLAILRSSDNFQSEPTPTEEIDFYKRHKEDWGLAKPKIEGEKSCVELL